MRNDNDAAGAAAAMEPDLAKDLGEYARRAYWLQALAIATEELMGSSDDEHRNAAAWLTDLARKVALELGDDMDVASHKLRGRQ